MSAAAQGSQRVASIRIIPIALFAIGIFSAALVVYQRFAAGKPYAVSKDTAIKIALGQVDREPDRDAALLPDKEATAKPVHVAAGSLAFIADEDSFPDMWLYGKDDRFAHEGGYLWHVDVTTSSAGGYRGYYYLIDADSGRIVGNDRESDFSGAP